MYEYLVFLIFAIEKNLDTFLLSAVYFFSCLDFDDRKIFFFWLAWPAIYTLLKIT